MPNKTTEDLISRLKNAQKNLSASKFDLKKLGIWGDEIVAAFNKTINSVEFKINIKEELQKKRDKLKAWKISWLKSIFPINFKYIFSAPFIYSMIIPGVIFHIGLEIYHQICFRIYGIPRVKVKDYFIYDRRLLPYLNWFEKLNCIYCSYFNNLIRYATEIAGRTERFWCPIKYATHLTKPHSQYHKFADFLDAKSFREKWQGLRDFSDIENSGQNNCNFKKSKKRSGAMLAGLLVIIFFTLHYYAYLDNASGEIPIIQSYTDAPVDLPELSLCEEKIPTYLNPFRKVEFSYQTETGLTRGECDIIEQSESILTSKMTPLKGDPYDYWHGFEQDGFGRPQVGYTYANLLFFVMQYGLIGGFIYMVFKK